MFRSQRKWEVRRSSVTNRTTPENCKSLTSLKTLVVRVSGSPRSIGRYLLSPVISRALVVTVRRVMVDYVDYCETYRERDLPVVGGKSEMRVPNHSSFCEEWLFNVVQGSFVTLG